MVVLDHDDKRTLPEIDPATGKPRLIAEDGLVMLQDCRARFAQQGIPSALLESRRGGHIFVFFDEPVDARDARALAFIGLGAEEAWRMHQGQQAFEVYPKQDRRSERDGAVGSNIALALGVHLKDGQRHPFIDEHGATVAHTLSGQLAYLETIARVPVRQILRARPWLYDELDRAMRPIKPRQLEQPAEPILDRALPAAPLHAPPAWQRQPAGQESSQGRRPSLIAQWKVAVDCRDIVRAYGVELNENGVGRCPFHDDQHASFQAWADGWRCYAENRGGDALHFVMEQEGLSPKEALMYVRERFPVPGLAREAEGGRGRA